MVWTLQSISGSLSGRVRGGEGGHFTTWERRGHNRRHCCADDKVGSRGGVPVCRRYAAERRPYGFEGRRVGRRGDRANGRSSESPPRADVNVAGEARVDNISLQYRRARTSVHVGTCDAELQVFWYSTYKNVDVLYLLIQL
jgi:hypothetical protein